MQMPKKNYDVVNDILWQCNDCRLYCRNNAILLLGGSKDTRALALSVGSIFSSVITILLENGTSSLH
jgi:hypothetical protein